MVNAAVLAQYRNDSNPCNPAIFTGAIVPLNTLLGLVQPITDDIVVTLGDYVDRGPMSSRVIDCLIELDHSTRLVPLRGNHECMMTLARNSLHDARRWMVKGALRHLIRIHWTMRNRRQFGRTFQFSIGNFPDIDFCHTGKPRVLFLFMAASIQISRWRNNPKLRCNGNNSRCRKAIHHSGKIVVCGHERQGEWTAGQISFCNLY